MTEEKQLFIITLIILIVGVGTLVALCVVTSGCALPGFPTAPTIPPEEYAPVFPARTGMLRRAVIAGLTKVDPAANGGWDGDCPGCDVDADVMALLCREQGLQVSLHHNAQASAPRLVAAARAAWRDMKAGDLFVFYISGHGGQERDTSGDEEDGQDETLCLWDGPLSDDFLRGLWDEMPPGIRVLFITDTCNSGTNFKARSYRRTVPRRFGGQLIHFGGCDDGKSSYGSASGGVWTTALIDAWKPGIPLRVWYMEAASRMTSKQVPAYAEYGDVTEAFRNGAALR